MAGDALRLFLCVCLIADCCLLCPSGALNQMTHSSTTADMTVVLNVVVTDGDEVVRIYDSMRTDPRMKYFF